MQAGDLQAGDLQERRGIHPGLAATRAGTEGAPPASLSLYGRSAVAESR